MTAPNVMTSPICVNYPESRQLAIENSFSCVFEGKNCQKESNNDRYVHKNQLNEKLKWHKKKPRKNKKQNKNKNKQINKQKRKKRTKKKKTHTHTHGKKTIFFFSMNILKYRRKKSCHPPPPFSLLSKLNGLTDKSVNKCWYDREDLNLRCIQEMSRTKQLFLKEENKRK